MLKQNGGGMESVWAGEELTKNYIKLVIAPQMGRGIMPNRVWESPVISFLKVSGNPV